MSRRQRDRKAKRLRHSRSRRVAMGATVALGAAFVAPAVSHADNAPIVVSDAGDAGTNTLRAAITTAESQTGPDTITFASSITGSGAHIDLATALPKITQPLTITGPGAASLTINGPASDRIFYANMNNAGDALTISGLTLDGGHGDASASSIKNGGAILAKYTDLTVDHSVVSENQAENGGGIATRAGTTVVSNSTVAGNTANASGGGVGGGIDSVQSTLTVSRSEITGNQAIGSSGIGGGIYAGNATTGFSSKATISDSLVADNTAGENGGGVQFRHIATDPNTDAINNTTIFHNTATSGYGGGVFSTSVQGNTVKPLAIDSSTITSNGTAHGGGGVQMQATAGSGSNVPAATINNTILAQNTTTTGEPDIDIDGPIDPTAVAFTLVQHAPGSGVMTESVPESNKLSVDPDLGGLAQNGGPTRTLALNGGSPAIDAGSTALTADQRGSVRPSDFPSIPNSTAAGADGADMGAFEAQYVPPPPPPPVVQPQPGPTFGKLSTGGVKVGPNSVSIVLTCASANCDGVLNVFTTEKLNGNRVVGLARRKHRKRIKVGSKAYHLVAAQRKRITVKLDRSGKKLLRRFRKLPVKLVVIQKQTGGKSVTVKNVKRTIKVKKKKRR